MKWELFKIFDLRQKTQHKNTSFLKEIVENADLYKAVLNKITTTQE